MYSLELAKRLTALSRGAHKTYFNNVFSGKDRIYFPLNSGEDSNLSSSAYEEIKTCLINNGYRITDYVGGYATKDGKQTLKIGKILNSINEQQLLNLFKQDQTRIGDNLSVVISRHPYDIGGMSTGRDWKSCMKLSKDGDEDGSYANYVKHDIMSGTLVAYLISNSDQNITKPLSRCLIKPYFNKRGHRYMSVSSKSYGIPNDKFIPTVNYVVKNLFNKNCVEDIYSFPDFHYNDDDKKTIDIRSEDTKRKSLLKLKSKYDNDKKSYTDSFINIYESLSIKPDKFQYMFNLSNWLSFNDISSSIVSYYNDALVHGGRFIYDWVKKTFNPSPLELALWINNIKLNYDAWAAILLDMESDDLFLKLSNCDYNQKKSTPYKYNNDELIDRFISMYDNYESGSSSLMGKVDKFCSQIWSNNSDRIDRLEELIQRISKVDRYEAAKIAYGYLSFYCDRTGLPQTTPLHELVYNLYRNY